MSSLMPNASSRTRAGKARLPQVVRAHVVPHARGGRRHRFANQLCGPSLMSLSPLDSLFDLSPSHLLETEEFEGLQRARVMAVDFVEDNNSFQIKADIPGVAKEDIKLDVDHNLITISAKRSTQSSTGGTDASTDKPKDASDEDKSGDQTVEIDSGESEEKITRSDVNVLRYERFDSFQSRSFRVPNTADLSTISAKYADGVLTVDIKKREDAVNGRRTVDIA